MPFKLIALGTGVCANGCFAGERRYPPGFLVDYNGQLLLLEASEGIRFRIEDAGYDFGQVGQIAISHSHPDHAALPQLLQAKLCRVLWGVEQPGIHEAQIYLSEALVQGFDAVWSWHHPEAGGKLNHFPDKFNFYLNGVRTGWRKEIFPGLFLSAFGVYHGFGQHPALGYKIEVLGKTIVYTGDAGMTDGLFHNIEKADLLICDSGIGIGHEYTGGYGHMGPTQAGMLAARGQVKELWLTHYTGADAAAAMEAKVREAGYNGMVKIVKDGEIYQAE